MTEALPNAPQTPYAQVQWRVASIHADGADADSYPDWIPAVGERVILTPSLKEPLIVYDVAGPEPWTVTVSPVEGVINETGLLTKPDGRPVLIAASDDPLMSHRGWTWTATFKGHKITFSAPAGETVDLSNFVALPATEQVESWVGEIPTLITSSEALRTAVETAGTGIESITKIGPNTIQFMLVGGITHDVTLEGIPGKSAYQLAVDAGFVGTEVEWLASLKGADSTVPGPEGPPGDKGDKGDKGDPGLNTWVGINAQTAAYTLTASDVGKLITVNAASAMDVTVPSGVFSAGERVDVLDLGAERVTFVAGSGMTLSGTPSLVSRAQYSVQSIIFLSSTEAVVAGDLA